MDGYILIAAFDSIKFIFAVLFLNIDMNMRFLLDEYSKETNSQIRNSN